MATYQPRPHPTDTQGRHDDRYLTEAETLALLDAISPGGGTIGEDLANHIADTDNPHVVTAEQVGLGNVDNTSDADKPISTATQAALDEKADDADLAAHASETATHGATGAIVGTTNTQTLTNKTLTSPAISSFSNAQHNHSGSSSGGTIAHSSLTEIGSNTHADIDVGLLASALHNALTAAHGATGAVVGTTNTQTLTNKTLTTPTIASFANAGHTHVDAAGGGKLTAAAIDSESASSGHVLTADGSGGASFEAVPGGGGGGGGMDTFALAGDTGTPQTISDGNTLTVAGGIGIDTAAGATDTVTVSLDSGAQASLALADTAVQDLSDLGVTADAAELNILDGATLSTTELNRVTGVTSAIQTQLNTISGSVVAHALSTAEHGATGAVVGTTNTQTLTNKTLTTPTIGNFTNAQHAHTGASSGGQIAHGSLTSIGTNTHAQIDTHIASTSNPHDVTKSQVGLGNVPNVDTTADQLVFVFDGGGDVIPVNQREWQRIPYNCTITGWTFLGDVTGSIVADVQVDTYANYPPNASDSIAGSAKPTISSSNKGQSSTLTGWTTSLTEGHIIAANVDSRSGITHAVLCLHVSRA